MGERGLFWVYLPSRYRRRSALQLTLLALFIVCASLAALLPTAVATAAPLSSTAPVRQAAATSGHVTILVLDMSGSMQQNDPDGIRCSAANAYIDLSAQNDEIGVVGLDNGDGAAGGPHHFQRAQIWAEPTSMSTLSARERLRQTIADKSHNCAPDGNTPTYDALNQALTMLRAATNGGNVSGSVILLTDGVPAPNTTEQTNAIQQELLPQFQQHHWSVDAIALGTGQDFGFLHTLANTTNGMFFDDVHGAASLDGQPSPLNIASFFVQIFAQRNGRTLGPTIAPTSLTGSTSSYDIAVGNYVDQLAVLAVNDTAGTQITLTSPSGQTINGNGPGVQTASDPHYVLFAISGPAAGTWQLNVTGSGRFLMDSLIVPSLQVHITSPAANGPVLPLGQDLPVTATITSKNTLVVGGHYNMQGTVTYVGGVTRGSTPQHSSFTLTDSQHTGVYQSTITIPESATRGSYDIHVAITQVSDVAIATDDRTVRMELFPQPVLCSYNVCPSSGATNRAPMRENVLLWDPFVRAFYALPWPQVVRKLGLRGIPVNAQASIPGIVELQGHPYSHATVRVSATRQSPGGRAQTVNAAAVSDRSAHFHVLLPYSGTGAYTLSFQTSGAFQDNQGAFGTTSQQVQPVLVSPTGGQVLLARGVAVVTLATFALILVLLFLFARVFCLSRPFGALEAVALNERAARPQDARILEFCEVRRKPLSALLHPNTIQSERMGLYPGVTFRFLRRGQIEVKSATRNFTLDGDPLGKDFTGALDATLTEPDGARYVLRGKQSHDLDGGPDGSEESEDNGYDESDVRPPRGRHRLALGRHKRPDTSDDDGW